MIITTTKSTRSTGKVRFVLSFEREREWEEVTEIFVVVSVVTVTRKGEKELQEEEQEEDFVLE